MDDAYIAYRSISDRGMSYVGSTFSKVRPFANTPNFFAVTLNLAIVKPVCAPKTECSAGAQLILSLPRMVLNETTASAACRVRVPPQASCVEDSLRCWCTRSHPIRAATMKLPMNLFNKEISQFLPRKMSRSSGSLGTFNKSTVRPSSS